MHARLRGPSSPNYKKEPDFPCLANEIAEPRQYMNIKVAAFTVSEKSINTLHDHRTSYVAIGLLIDGAEEPTRFLSMFLKRNISLSSTNLLQYAPKKIRFGCDAR